MRNNNENELPLIPECRKLRKAAESMVLLKDAQRLALRLEQAERRAASVESRPIVIAMIGGTGVGKSALFNALLEQPNASPVSDTVRPATRKPYIAAGVGAEHIADMCDDVEIVDADTGIPGLALVDTPDVDSVEKSNLHLCRQAVELADILLYVATPDKRANFDIAREVGDWAARKRWFFVMNKIDTAVDEREAVLKDFAVRLESLGFHATRKELFAVDAMHPKEYDLERLRRTIFSSQLAEGGTDLREDHRIAILANALEDDLIGRIKSLSEDLSAKLDEEVGKVQNIYRDVLESETVRNSLSVVLRESVWRELGGRVGGPLGWAVWLRARAARLPLAFSLGRLAWRPGLLGAVSSVWHAAMGAIKGVLPVSFVLSAFDRQSEDRLAEVRRDCERILEDAGMDAVDMETKSDVGQDGDEEEALLSQMPVFGRKLLRRLISEAREGEPKRQFLYAVGEGVDRAARKCALRATPAIYSLVGNLLPLVMLGHIVFRVWSAWTQGTWLPGAFYLNALFVFGFSLLPGTILLSLSVRRVGKFTDSAVAQIVDGIRNPGQTELLRLAVARLDALAGDARRLRSSALERRRLISESLQSGTFGMTREQ